MQEKIELSASVQSWKHIFINSKEKKKYSIKEKNLVRGIVIGGNRCQSQNPAKSEQKQALKETGSLRTCTVC